MIMTDAFSKCHPAVNFLFFAGAIGCSVVIQHPAYLLAEIVTGLVYYLLLNGRKAYKMLLGMLLMFVALTAINPLFNTYGETTLFCIFTRPYTLEALCHGAAIAAVFLTMMLWFGCYNAVMTSDKFTSLFGNVIPALSLLLVMVLRLIPSFMRKAAQITGARKSIGKGAGEGSATREKLTDGMLVLSSLTDWALEGSVVTGDSMRARGYGAAKRSSFMIYRMTATDWLLLACMLILLMLVMIAACLNQMAATYTPAFEITPISLWIFPYTAYFLIPIALHTKEAIQWNISRSKI